MRTPDELMQYLKDDNSFFGFGEEALMPYLNHERPLTRECVEEDLKTYMMEYGIEKAINHRGISACRTIEKLKAWLFALGENELYKFLDDDNNYAQYGAPMLAKVCERYGIDQPDTREWHNMTRGIKCQPDCDGCEYE